MRSAAYAGRVRRLEALLSLIHTFATEIRYRAAPLPDLLRRVAEREDLKPLSFLKDCSKACADGIHFPDAWRQNVTAWAKRSDLNDADTGVLLSFGAGLGTTDVAGQLSNCALHAGFVEEALQKSRREKDQFGRLYASLGLLAGLGAAVLFI